MRLKIYCWFGLGFFVALSALDLLMTFALLKMNPSAYESNPMAAAFLKNHGWSGLALYKAAGVAVFVSSVLLLMHRRLVVGARVVTFGCVTLLGVTGYSHSLIAKSHADQSHLFAWWECKARPRLTGNETLTDLTKHCWFAAPPETDSL